MQKIIAANFKTNHTRKSTLAYAKDLDSFLAIHKPQKNIYIFPPISALINNHFQTFQIGTQNAYSVQNGAFTGEIGLEQIHEFGIQSILIGHSERRLHFGESQSLCAQKFAFFAKENFEIFYCIGEDLATKQKGIQATIDFLFSQFEGINSHYEHLIIAYEPIWAIGTGVSASLDEIASIHERLKKAFPNIPLLYGGSVKASNAKDILSLFGVDGVLVGSASVKLEDFQAIIKA